VAVMFCAKKIIIMMFKKIKYIIITLITLFSVNASAQKSQVMYNMKIPQSHFMNPALKPSGLFYIGLPVLTSISTNFSNNFLQLTDLFPKGEILGSGLPTSFDINRLSTLSGSLKEKNTITADANIQLFGLGFMAGPKLNIFIDVIDRLETRATFPKDIMKLYITGADQFLNQSIDLSGLNIRAQFFREFGAGFSRNFTQKLRVGAKAKLLFGMGSLNFNNRSLSLLVGNDSSRTVTADASLEISGQTMMSNLGNNLSQVGKFVKDYLNPPYSNPGFGIDLGAVYDFNKMISVSLSVTDLGFISWKNDLTGYDANSSFVLPKYSLKDFVNQTISFESIIHELRDTIQNSFKENANPPAFTTYLPTTLSAGANLNLFPVLSLGILSTTIFYSGQVKEAITFSANTYLGRAFSASIGYTLANYNYNNLGFGMAFKAGPVQIYLIADKIPLKWTNLRSDNGNGGYNKLPLPQNMNMLNVQIGLNISFGKIISKKADKPMVLVE
jgi:hypothetical protein